MSKKVKVYKIPSESPAITAEDAEIRIRYNDQWVVFKDGDVVVTAKDGLAVTSFNPFIGMSYHVMFFMAVSGLAFWINFIVEVMK